MAVMEPAQIAFVRAKSGDDCTPYLVDADLLSIYFDAANSDLPRTIVSVLEDRWAKAKAEAGRITDFGTSVDSANIEHIKNLLDYWRKKAGLDAEEAGGISAGVISLGIDAVDPVDYLW
jgi:hypothetical protein